MLKRSIAAFRLHFFQLINVILCKSQRRQKNEVRKAYRSKVLAIDDDGKHSGVATKQKKRTDDDDLSVSMLTVEEVCYYYVSWFSVATDYSKRYFEFIYFSIFVQNSVCEMFFCIQSEIQCNIMSCWLCIADATLWRPSVCLSVRPSVCPSICLSHDCKNCTRSNRRSVCHACLMFCSSGSVSDASVAVAYACSLWHCCGLTENWYGLVVYENVVHLSRLFCIQTRHQCYSFKSVKSSLLMLCMLMTQALLAVQLDTGSCIRFIETDVDLAKMVLQYTKSVAERPYKYAVCY